MSVTVTLDTIEDSVGEFVRDVLRNNLTDTQNPARSASDWILKGMPKRRVVDYPLVIISSNVDVHKNVFGNNYVGADVVVHIEVWSDKNHDKEIISDKIISVLGDATSADSDSTTMADNSLFFMHASADDADTTTGAGSKIIMIKSIDIELSYGGV